MVENTTLKNSSSENISPAEIIGDSVPKITNGVFNGLHASARISNYAEPAVRLHKAANSNKEILL